MNIRAAKFVQNLRGLTLSEKSVAQAIAIHADYADAEANMSMTLLAAESGIKNRETASRIVGRLEAKGIITTVSGTHSEGGRGQTTAFRFTFTVNCESGVTLTSAEAERRHPETVTGEPETVTPEAQFKPETVTQNAETVTPQSHEGFKVLSLPPAGIFSSGSPCEPASKGEPDEERPAEEKAPQAVVVGEKNAFPLYPPSGNGSNAAEAEMPAAQGESRDDNPAPLRAASRNPLPHRESSPIVTVSSSRESQVRENQSQRLADKENIDARAERLVRDAEHRQSERRLTNSQICDEFKSIFDRLRQQCEARAEYSSSRFIGSAGHRVPNPAFDQAVLDSMPNGMELTWKRPLPKHQKAAAEYFKAVGRDVALANWEDISA